jgi:hypothetical protein
MFTLGKVIKNTEITLDSVLVHLTQAAQSAPMWYYQRIRNTFGSLLSVILEFEV